MKLFKRLRKTQLRSGAVKRKFFTVLASALLLAIVISSPALADVILDRPTLNVLLGPAAVTEDFESYSIGVGNAGMMNSTTLNSASIINGQGPGLVVNGVTFIGGNNGLQWNGAAYFGQPSKDILSDSTGITIDFTVPVTAFGLDLLVFSGYPDTATVTIYAANDAAILTTISGIALSSPGSPVFFGYQDAGGIGRAVISGSAYSWSPIIDDLTFGGVPTQETCTHTMNMPTSPTNIGTFTPGIYMSYDPMVARPFGLEEAGDILTGRLWLPCWRNGHADIYLVLDAPAYGGKFMLSELHQWLSFPANIQPWQTNTDNDVYAELFSLQKSGILPGNYKLDVIVVPSGTAASTIDQIVSGAAAAPYYKWSFTETLP